MSDLTKYTDEELLDLSISDIDGELKSRGYSYGWHKNVEYAGVIYILVNPAFPVLVKIGYADDIEKRLKTLNRNSGLPDPYHVYATYKVKKRLEDLKLHDLIDSLDSDLRHAKNREFYEMTPEKAFEILSAIAEINGDEDLLVKNPFNDSFFDTAPVTVSTTPTTSSAADRRHNLRIQFWTTLNSLLPKKGNPFNKHKAWEAHWYDVRVKTTKWWLSMNIVQKDATTRALFLTHDKAIFDDLLAQKDAIEKDFGATLIWDRGDGKKSSIIMYKVSGFDLEDTSQYEAKAEELIDLIVKMRDVFKKYIK